MSTEERKGTGINSLVRQAPEAGVAGYVGAEMLFHTKQLKESKDLLKATIDSSIDMIQVFRAVRNDKNEIVDFVWILNNSASEKVYGDVIGKSLLTLNPGVLQVGIFNTFKKVVETGIPDRSERYYVSEQFNGWFHQSTVKLNDGVATTTRDITERKIAEQENLWLKDEIARKAEDKYHVLFNYMDEGYCIIQMLYDEQGKPVDWRFLEVNPAFERHNGLSEASGKTIRELTPDIESKWMDIYGRVAETGESIRFEESSDALHRVFDLYAFRIGEPEERKVAVLFTDITKRTREIAEKIRAEEALRKAEMQYRMQAESEVRQRTAELEHSHHQLQSIFDTTLVQMFILEARRDSRGNIADLEIKIVNKEMARETGRLDLVGKRYAEEYPEIRKNGLFNLIVNTINTGQPHATEYFQQHEGTEKWFSCVFVKMGDGVVATSMDITARMQAEEKIRRMEAEQRLEIFRASLSAQEEERRRISESLHNGLGQILYAVKLGLANLSEENAKNDPEKFRKNSRYTDDLLSNAINETRSISHELMPMMLRDYGLQASLEDVCRQLGEKISIKCNVHGLYKRLDDYLELAVYRFVQELLLNVVRHADATMAGVDLNVVGRNIKIRVSDNGKGFDNGKTSKKGIGLSSMRNKVSLLNGSMQVSSNAGKGTVVKIEMPLTAG